jgi:membrane fusion protein, multidrug efflux system
MTRSLRYISLPLLMMLLGYALFARGEDEPKEAAASALVETNPVQFVPMTETLTAYGTVEYAPESAHVLDVQGEGLVSKVFVAAGQRVRKGDLLLELTATANARTELGNARITVTFARKDLARLRDLKARQLATNAEVQAAEQTLAKAEALLDNVLKRQGDKAIRELRAGMDGVVDVVNVHQGEIAASGAPLLRLAKGNRLRVRLGVEAEDLQAVQEGQTVRVAPLYPGAPMVDGQVQQIYRQIDPKTRLAEVVVPLLAAPGLLPGAMVRGEIVVNHRPEVLAVPRGAVLTEGGKPHVFVVENGRAVRHVVEVGQEDGALVEVRGGLKVGDSVVSLGNYELQDGMPVRRRESK